MDSSVVLVHKNTKYKELPTFVFNCEIKDIACSIAPIQQNIADLHVINISCWYDKYKDGEYRHTLWLKPLLRGIYCMP